MTLLFRIDANREFGFGHLVRSISLVNELRSRSMPMLLRIVFAGNYSESAMEMMQRDNIEFVNYNIDNEYAFIASQIALLQPSLLYIDKIYPYGKEFIEQIQKQLPVVMMHNLCEASPYCTCFILPSAHTPHEKLSEFGLTRAKPNWFIGAEYIVLNRQVVNAVPTAKKGDMLQLVVTTGGSDPEKVLLRLLQMLRHLPIDKLQIQALYGPSIGFLDELQNLQLPHNICIMPFAVEYLQQADMAICTFGISTYELMYLGIPVISVAHAQSNALGSKTLAENHRSIIDLGIIDKLEAAELHAAIGKLTSQPELRASMSALGRQLVDAKGVCRVGNIILKTLKL
ncbi:MAG TPA: hypothetical protein PLZ52_01005 [Bacteroidales bacterium]|nr:hypothetical protein [Bacteroidales bacterium]HQL69798.1 hypothetical protein [Bacteroidales bacterium]